MTPSFKSIEFQLNKGEYLSNIIPFEGRLIVKTNFGRVFMSTNVPVEHLDFVEVL